jgi:hypothetical protein
MEKPSFNLDTKAESTQAEKTFENFKLSEHEKNIQEVFKLNPELENVGSKEKYQEYLNTIFSDSKVKEILWHYSDAEFKDEGFKPLKPNFDTLNSIEGVYNFTTNEKFAQRYGKNPYAVVLNVTQPMQDTSSGEYVDDMDQPLSKALYVMGKQTQANFLAPAYDESKKDTDAFINTNTGEDYIEKHPVSGREIGLPPQKIISVFNPDQIHILGSKSDIEQFKEFVSKDKEVKS